MRAVGAGFLLIIGGRAVATTSEVKAGSQPPDPEGLSWYYASTFALTLINPVTLLAFLGIFAAVGLSRRSATIGHAAILVLGVLVGSLLWWLGLSFGIGLFRRSIEPRHLAWINRGSGAILLLSGAALLADLLAGWR